MPRHPGKIRSSHNTHNTHDPDSSVPVASAQSQFQVISFDDQFALVETPDGARIQVARTPGTDQQLGLTEQASAQVETLAPGAPVPIEQEAALLQEPEGELSFFRQSATAPDEGRGQTDPRDLELESPEEELTRLETFAASRFISACPPRFLTLDSAGRAR